MAQQNNYSVFLLVLVDWTESYVEYEFHICAGLQIIQQC